MKRYFPLLLFCLFCAYTCAEAFNFGLNFGFGAKNNAKYEALAPSLAWSPMSSVFGNTTTGKSHVAQFTITNSGNDLAEDVAVSTSSPFSIYSTVTQGNISSSRSRIVKVRYTPTAAQTDTAYVNYSGPNIARTGAKLRGTGVVASSTGVLLGWNGLYNAATASPGGQTLTAATLSAGSSDGTYPPSTTIDAAGDSMSVGSLTWAAGIASQSGKEVIDMNQGTLMARVLFTDLTTTGQYFAGKYTTSAASQMDFYFNGNAVAGSRRIYCAICDGQATQHCATCYRTYDPGTTNFHNLSCGWDLDVDGSVKISIDGDAFSCSSHTGTESSIVLDFAWTNYFFANRSTTTAFRGEISDVEISSQYGAALSPQ